LQNPLHGRSRDIPFFYRLMRAVVRLGLWLFFPRLRVLNRERLEQTGPFILLISHPQSFSASLLLVSALDHQVHCLLPPGKIRGFFRKLAARALGMRAFDFTTREQDIWLSPCLNLLEDQEMVALFAGATLLNGAVSASVADFAARLAVEATLQEQGRLEPTIYPLHWFLGTGRCGPEPLVYVDNPIQANEFLPKIGEDLVEASAQLVEAIQIAITGNVFGLAEAELEIFTGELEDLSREDLRIQWSRRPNWKQRPEDLQLSSVAKKWVSEQNLTDPARLVELREALDTFREARRQCSMEEFITEVSGPWQASGAKVAAAWLETVLGFPAALYGLVNHLPAVIALGASGLFNSSPKRDPKVEWLFRIFIVLSSYTAQVFIVHFWWGRAAAGYYTLTLPVSAAYLWRYRWLLHHRIHVLFRKLLHPSRSARVTRERKNLLDRFGMEFERFLRISQPPKEPSTDFAE
jgi:glycerol-3-phosphate O-acyltransferase/dihydroxyacetone phosphate acyltransferase